MESPLAYWNERYRVGLDHHATQNRQIGSDFLNAVAERARSGDLTFDHALRSRRILEVGCGTGELCALIADRYQTPLLLGTDFSEEAVRVARQRHPHLPFHQLDILHDQLPGTYDLCVCSNTLEHFRDPYFAIDRMFSAAPQVLAIVPYGQPAVDGYNGEGGAGHVFTFSEASLDRYQLQGSFTFRTAGWQHSSAGEPPLQLAVLLLPRSDCLQAK